MRPSVDYVKRRSFVGDIRILQATPTARLEYPGHPLPPARAPNTPRVGHNVITDFVGVTELTGDEVSGEQIERLTRRYHWAGEYCGGLDVLEVACGAGQGVGYLMSLARSVTAGDISYRVLDAARRHYGKRFDFQVFDAQSLPFAKDSFHVVIIFEAIYYIPHLDQFFEECCRVLRPGGRLLIATANKDLFDFTPSPNSHCYLGVSELCLTLPTYGFSVECFGDTPVDKVSLRQRILRPIKAAASRLGLVPTSMGAKKWLKRLVFGELRAMPGEVTADLAPRIAPTPLSPDRADARHKVIFCAATLSSRRNQDIT